LAPRDGSTVVERAKQWLSRRQMKLDEQRRQLESAEVEEFSFTPVTRASTTYRDPSLSVGTPGGNNNPLYGDGNPWGTDEFLRRQEDARRIAKERAEKLTPRSTWSPHSTIPQEFQFGRKQTPVRSLGRFAPISAVDATAVASTTAPRSVLLVPPTLRDTTPV